MGPWRRLFWSIGFVKADVAGCARTAELAVPVANALQTELSHFSIKYVLFILLRSLIDIGIKNSNCWDRMVMRVSYALALILLKTGRILREKTAASGQANQPGAACVRAPSVLGPGWCVVRAVQPRQASQRGACSRFKPAASQAGAV